MTLRQMEYFVAVAESGSFSQAAQALHVSQPGLSQQVQQLEREVGVQLLERLPRLAVLTEAGRAYLPEARRILSASRQAKRAARNAVAGISGDLEIATVTSVACGVLARSFPAWRQRFPDLNVKLYEYTHCEALQLDVEAGKGDFGIGVRPANWKGRIIRLGTEEMVVVLPMDDPLAAASVVDIADLSDRPWVEFPAGHGLREITDSLCLAAGFKPKSAVQASQLATGVRLAAAGFGAVIVPELFVPVDVGAAVLRLKEPWRRELAAFARTDFSPVALAFIEMLRFTTSYS